MGDDVCGLRGCGGSAYKAWNASLAAGSSMHGSSSSEKWKSPDGAQFQCAVCVQLFDISKTLSCLPYYGQDCAR